LVVHQFGRGLAQHSVIVSQQNANLAPLLLHFATQRFPSF
jgi:hypothetical protein